MTEATEEDIAAVIVAAQTSNSNICAAALQQKFVITRRTHQAVAPDKREIIEECARVAEKAYADPNWHMLYRMAGARIAASIRDLVGNSRD